MMKKIKFEYRITLLYILLGSMWILFSDELLFRLINDPGILTTMQTYKGWFFVLVSALVFYFILRTHLARLRSAELRARESDALKTAFLRNVSHEIRTPMNSIVGFATLLSNDGIPDVKKSEYLKIISNSSRQLLDIVNEILDSSLIETGNLAVNEKNVNLNRVMDEVHSLFQPLIRPGVEFYMNKGMKDTDSMIITDELMVKKVLSNIINNAVKFTEKGHITVSYLVSGDEIEFSIEDTGIGISAEFLPSLFSRFHKADTSQSQYYEGLGLGLSISKGNIDLLKGRIWVESFPGKGSKFYFSIPFKPVTEEL
jgi:signal transduction histidine kinase